MAKRADACTTTGELVAVIPPGPFRDEVLGLVRLGLAFKAQHRGRRPGFLARTLLDLARAVEEPLTFEKILVALESAAVRRDIHGAAASPIERVDRVWGLMTYHDPRKGRLQVTLKTIQNLMPFCKKNLSGQSPGFRYVGHVDF